MTPPKLIESALILSPFPSVCKEEINWDHSPQPADVIFSCFLSPLPHRGFLFRYPKSLIIHPHLLKKANLTTYLKQPLNVLSLQITFFFIFGFTLKLQNRLSFIPCTLLSVANSEHCNTQKKFHKFLFSVFYILVCFIEAKL